MKFFHTADWHIGKIVNEFSMLDDQRVVLEQLVRALRTEQPDALIIAGDLYDRSVPPADAVALVNETLNKIVNELKIPVLAIAGNHDGATRLGFLSDILKHQGLHIAGVLSANIHTVTLHDADGPVHFYLVPYAEPSAVRHVFDAEHVTDHESAM
ncbi:MAG: metallophosphoesterase family protein, partial [Bacilli bacterium]